jgi:hypothetical protein
MAAISSASQTRLAERHVRAKAILPLPDHPAPVLGKEDD